MKKIFAELFELFVKTNKREPNAIETLQLKFKASQQVGKGEVISFPRERITDFTKARPQPPEIEIIDGVQTTRGLGDLFERQMKNIGKKNPGNKNQPFDPNDPLPYYKETPGEYSRRNTPGSIENLREEMKIAYRKEFDRLTGNETAEELTDMLKNLDTDGVPFAEGGSTSTGLNYLVGEDDTNSRVPYATGGRRGFLKILAGLGAAGAAFKTGLLSLGKGAAKPAAKVAAEAATSGAPPHFFKLVAKIKALGDDVTEKAATQDRQVVKQYKDFEMIEDVSTGEIQIFKKSQSDEAIDRFASENANEEVFMRYKPGKGQADETTKGKAIADEYEENTSYISNNRENTGEILEEISGVPDDIFLEVGETVPEIIRKTKADGGRMGYAGGKKVVEGLASLIKKKFGDNAITTADKLKTPQKTLDREMFKKTNDRLNDKRTMNADELEDFEMEIGPDQLEGYDFDGTIGDAKRILKEDKAYEAEMYQQYKMGKLDPVAGDKSPARKRFLEQKLEEMEASGDSRLMTREEIEELTFFDLGTEMQTLKDGKTKSIIPKDEYAEYSKDFDKEILNKEIKQGVADVMSDTSPEGLAKSIEIDNLMLKYEGMDKNLADQIASSSPTMKADMIAMVEQSLKMDEMGMSADDIIQTFKNTTRKKQATGGRIGLLSGGGVLKKLIMNLAKEKKMKPSGILKIMNYKNLPSKVKNLMTKEEFDRMKANRLEGVEIWKDLMSSQQDLVKNVEAGKNTPAAGLFEELEKTSPGYGTVPRNISDADILQMEQMIKNMKTKGNRQLNAMGGLANLLGE
jgi:hypothetical protein